jgi:hypothetical protein
MLGSRFVWHLVVLQDEARQNAIRVKPRSLHVRIETRLCEIGFEHKCLKMPVFACVSKFVVPAKGEAGMTGYLTNRAALFC